MVEEKRSKRSPKKKRKTKRRRHKPRPQLPPEPLRAQPVDEARSVEEPLSAVEVEEMRGHLHFLARHRKLLRLKPNAAEDRLLNGSQEPSHRGVCLHLLRKVDRATVQSALDRVGDAGERTRLLEGVVRFSNDAAIVISYLESLSESGSRVEAARALAAGFARIDFDNVSAAQMRRILDLVVRLFSEAERPQLLLGLLASGSFRAAFDAVEMPDDLAAILTPIRAAHAAAFAGEPAGFDRGEIVRGVGLLLNTDDRTLRAYPVAARRRLFELGLQVPGTERALDALLGSFPPAGRDRSTLAMMRVADDLRRHQDERARGLLERLVSVHEGFRLPRRWLDALARPRVGRIAVAETQTGWQRGFWLDRQRSVLVRTGSEEMSAEALLHRALLVPSLAPLMLSGRDGEVSFLAVEAVGTPGRWWRPRGADERRRWSWARDGVCLLASVAGAGVALPDCEPDRFLVDNAGRLWLFDLRGARGGDTDLLQLARAWCGSVLGPDAEAVTGLGSVEEMAAKLAEGSSSDRR
jgi:hypothetical protein